MSARAIQPAVELVTRDYEAYVEKDRRLSEHLRDAKLQTSRMLRELVGRAAEGGNNAER